ncbi:MAG: cryptochrome/photolyase family protein [Deltaproteobacteria bacterium]|jgi:deoxyribodipyrimidine photolyase-related protein|nr:cryptochrome/photolyase family protein [Deltaproteobacteria bacterium]
MSLRNLIVIYGDQLNQDSPVFKGFDKSQDRVWMAESVGEASHVHSTKSRIAIFFAAMRHFREELTEKGYSIEYHEVNVKSKSASLKSILRGDLKRIKPVTVRCVQPGEWRTEKCLKDVCRELHIELELLDDTHFLSKRDFFQNWASGRKELRLEYFYRELRKRHNILIDGDGKPIGGNWNYDADNRMSFGKRGPHDLPVPLRFEPDSITREVIDLVNKIFDQHPGTLDHFVWPTCRKDAIKALKGFIRDRLPYFGIYQDAMWTEEPFLYHSLLSSSLNLKLLNPLEVIETAIEAYEKGNAPINAVEGFVRQILGWREFIRHIYWSRMPGYDKENALAADQPLPDFYWTAETPLTCLRQTISQTLNYGYAHHIQRLMVTGLYSLLLGIEPKAISNWYLAVYIDAVEWVELPNVIGMSQYADGGYMSSKPYSATGKYIHKMSNYCQHCPMDPNDSLGEKACPFTTLYWDFLVRNRERLDGNNRMNLQLRNVDRLSRERLKAIKSRADEVKKDPSCRQLVNRSK